MKDGSVTLHEVIEAFKFLGGKAKSRQIEDYIIDARGGVLPKTYEYGGWNSYRETINQVIQFHCTRYSKYKGPEYFRYLGPRYYELLNFTNADNNSIVLEPRQIESHEYAHKTKIDENQFEVLLRKKREIGALGEEKVLEYERKYLIENGRSDMANNIRHISKQSISEGYDIISYDLDGNSKYIEVKSSKQRDVNFFITDNELATARALKDKYWIYRVVFVDDDNFDIIPIQNPVTKIEGGEWKLSALAYLVQST
jgi:hypothetical protein